MSMLREVSHGIAKQGAMVPALQERYETTIERHIMYTQKQVERAFNNLKHFDDWDDQIAEVLKISSEAVRNTLCNLSPVGHKWIKMMLNEYVEENVGMVIFSILSAKTSVRKPGRDALEQIGHIITEWVNERGAPKNRDRTRVSSLGFEIPKF